MYEQGEGSLDAKVWIIGEAYGAEEEKQNRPFVGGSGSILNGLLSEVGIKREDTYIDNVIRKRPPNNDFGIYYKDKGRHSPSEELLQAHQQLKQLISTHRPNVVIPLGNEPLFAITGRKGITDIRGSILSYDGVKVIPTIHPAMVMRMWDYRPIVTLDLARAKRESLTPNFPPKYNDNFILNPTFDQVIATLKFLETKEYVSFDIETGSEQILCLGFGWSFEDSICIPICYSGNNWWGLDEEVAIIKQIKKLFLNPKVKFIAQNAQFDMIYLADKWGVEVTNLWMDTMVAFHCVYPELEKGLGFINSVYTNRPYYKDMPGTGGGPNVLWHYNCLDTVVTWECAMAIRQELEEYGTLNFYQSNSHKLIKPLIAMQRRGVKLDMESRKKITENLKAEEEALRNRLCKVVGYDLNTNSSKQMKAFLYDDLNLPPVISEKTGNQTADEDALDSLFKKFNCPVFNLIIDIRKIRKLLSTYLEAEVESDGRMRCSYVITGTTTGRLSSRTNVYGRGTNLQNIPRGDIIRRIFIPDEGCIFINADLSQAEARVVAYLAREERLLNLFADSSQDIHKRNAAMVFNKRVTEVTEDERQLAKTLVHAANYGIGPRTFSRHIESTEARARELLNQYYSLYPAIKRWHLEINSEISRKRLLTTPFGRKRTFFGRGGPDIIREAIAYIPQSTVSDIINLGIIRAFYNLPPQWELLLQVHDSILMQVPTDTPPEHIKKFLKHYFEIPITINNQTMVIPIDIKWGSNWANLKKMEEAWKV
jgi:DNA polymerase-1